MNPEELADLQAKIQQSLDLLGSLTSRIDSIEQWQKNQNYISNGLDPNQDIKINSERNIQIGGFGMTSGFVYDASTGSVKAVRGAHVIGQDINSASTDGSSQSSPNSQMIYEHQPLTNGSTNQSFIYANRPPLYIRVGGVSITSGGSTLTDTQKNWTTNELAGAYVDVYDSNGTFQQTGIIASNTTTQITITGTWNFSDAGSSYEIFMPVYLGAADFPWRRLYITQDIRFGMGPSAGVDVIFQKFGSGSPEGVVTANVGSLYMRTDGGTGTTFYVKESGTGNTGWAATGSGGTSTPAGAIMAYGGSSAPSGYLLCDGSAVSRSTYSTLFGILSTTYGSGDGTTTFNVPDLRGRVPMGAGTGTGGGASGSGLPTGGTALTARSRGDWLGEQTHALSIAELAAHTHDLSQFTLLVSGSGSGYAGGLGQVNTAITNGVTASTGSGTAHNNIQPVMTTNFIIKT